MQLIIRDLIYRSPLNLSISVPLMNNTTPNNNNITQNILAVINCFVQFMRKAFNHSFALRIIVVII